MTLFDRSGHPTDEALAALAEGSLCAAQREQLAVHLTVCDACLLRLTEMDACGMPVLQPSRPLVEPALQQLRRRSAVEFIRRCGITAAAACFLFAGWRLELFEKLGDKPSRDPQLLVQLSAEFAEEVNDLNAHFADALRNAFDNLPMAEAVEQQKRSE